MDTAFFCSHNPLLTQAKGGYTSFTVIKRFYCTLGGSIKPLDSKPDLSASRKPELKKSVTQGDNSLVNQNISILINCFHIKRFLGQFPLTGGHVMNGSAVCVINIRRHGDQHFIFRKRNYLNLVFRQFEHHLP